MRVQAYKHLIHNCIYDEVISLLDLGVEIPREAMTFGAHETEALHEGPAQRGFGVLSLDGSPFPLGSTVLPRSLLGHITRKVGGTLEMIYYRIERASGFLYS
jgi:hypothetical protein